MPRTRPGPTLALLVGAAVVASFVIPTPGRAGTVAAALFWPISHPTGVAARSVAAALAPAAVDPESPTRPRDYDAVVAENVVLRNQAERLRAQLDVLVALNADRAHLGGDLRPRTTPAAVASHDPADQTLGVAATGLADGMAAVAAGAWGVAAVGTVTDTAGPVARVRLLTSPTHRPFGGRIVRHTNEGVEDVATEPFVVSGTGDALHIARHRTADLEQANVTPGDLVVLADADWPEVLQGVRVGRVASSEALSREPGFSRVTLTPAFDAHAVNEVHVVVRP